MHLLIVLAAALALVAVACADGVGRARPPFLVDVAAVLIAAAVIWAA